MTPTTPSPISDQAALLHRLNDATKPVDAADRNLIIRALFIAPTTGSAPVAEGWQLTETKNLDALIIAMERVQNKGYFPDSIKEAWGEFMCNPARVVAPASPAASVLTDAEMNVIYAYARDQSLTGFRLAVRALLAASMGGDKS